MAFMARHEHVGDFQMGSFGTIDGREEICGNFSCGSGGIAECADAGVWGG